MPLGAFDVKGAQSVMNNEALKGIRVADFSWVWAGPLATMLLTFLGAEVIKIETKTRVDQTRHGSITTGDSFKDYNASPIFNNANLNKKSVTINLKKPQGVELAKQLVAACDLTVENMRPGVMDKLGLGYKDLVKVKPDLVMLSSSGFGQQGPYSKYAGFAPIFAAQGGLAHLTGYEDGTPNTMSGVMDLRVGTLSSFIALAALHHQRKTGKGTYIDFSCSDAVTSLIGGTLMDYSMNQRSPLRNANHDEIMAPHNCYRCKGEDKWVSIAVATDEEWQAMCEVMGNPAWASEEAYSSTFNRWNNRETLDNHISEWTRNYTHYEVMEKLQKAGVAAMPSFNAEEILSDPHVDARQMFNRVTHPVLGEKVVLNPAWKLSKTPAKIKKCSPLLGEHNEEVFGGILGMSNDAIKSMIDEEIIY